MDRVIDIETSAEYAPWRWYAGALQQHHYAMLMATEIIMNPRRKESSRIWRGLDYVFEPPPLPPIARARWVLTQAWWKMEVYTGKRSLRAPTNLEQNLKQALKLSDSEQYRDARNSSASTDATLVEDDVPGNTGNTAKQKQSQTKPATGRTSSTNGTAVSDVALKRDEASPEKAPPTVPAGSVAQSPPKAPVKQLVDVDWV